MPTTNTDFEGVKIFEPVVWEDARGYFFESYNRQTMTTDGIDADFVQDNQALSSYGVIRGLHYQVGAHAQAKLVRVLEGEVLDVILDIRPESVTYGQWMSIRLSAQNRKQLFIPRGFAHGYAVLSQQALFFYKCDNYYDQDQQGGIRYDDPNLNIDWEIPRSHRILSDRDKQWPGLGQHRRDNQQEFMR